MLRRLRQWQQLIPHERSALLLLMALQPVLSVSLRVFGYRRTLFWWKCSAGRNARVQRWPLRSSMRNDLRSSPRLPVPEARSLPVACARPWRCTVCCVDAAFGRKSASARIGSVDPRHARLGGAGRRAFGTPKPATSCVRAGFRNAQHSPTNHGHALVYAGRTLWSAFPIPACLSHSSPVLAHRSPLLPPVLVPRLRPCLQWVHEWREKDGSVSLRLARMQDGTAMLRIMDQCDFFLDPRSATVGIEHEPMLDPETREHLLIDQALPRLLAEQGELVVHAACARIGNAGVLFIGRSGWGNRRSVVFCTDAVTHSLPTIAESFA